MQTLREPEARRAIPKGAASTARPWFAALRIVLWYKGCNDVTAWRPVRGEWLNARAIAATAVMARRDGPAGGPVGNLARGG